MNSERHPAGRDGAAAGSASADLSAGSVAGLRSLRQGLGECLESAGCDQDTIADAQLVLAEIATNAFVHDSTPQVHVHVECGLEQIVISVSHTGDVLPPAASAVAPANGTQTLPGGRGLSIVDQIALSREVANDAGRTTSIVRLAR